MSFELFRRIATDAITTPDLLTDRPSNRHARGRRPVSGASATLPTVTDVDPSTPAPPDAAAPALTADDLLRLTGGRLLARSSRPIRGAAVDSRLVTPGQLFVALPGERTDGHAHVADAIARGAAAVLVTRPPSDAAALGDVTVIRVADGQAALGAVAAGWRRRFTPLVVGITGSIAKTSTKEAVAAVLGAARRTLRTEGNMNNEIGLPLTLLRLGPEHEAAVLEMGMYVGGEIADLAAMARPSIGVVTAVQPVHLSRIGSLEAVEQAKGELLEALPADGTAILNEDDPIVARMDDRTAARALRYGFAETADVRADEVVECRRRRDALPVADARGGPSRPRSRAGPAVGPQRPGRARASGWPPDLDLDTIVAALARRLGRPAPGRAGPAARGDDRR